MVELFERFPREVVSVVEVSEVVYELRARHATERASAAAAVQVRVQEHYGTRQRVHRVLRVEGAGVALEVPPGEVHEDPLPLLRLAGEREPRQERAQRRVQRRARQLEVAHVLLRHRAGELVVFT